MSTRKKEQALFLEWFHKQFPDLGILTVENGLYVPAWKLSIEFNVDNRHIIARSFKDSKIKVAEFLDSL